jgi:cysteine desulfurase
VAHLTKNFTAENPLSPAVTAAISAAFEQGWADPKKLSQASGRAAILAQSAIEEIAELLKTTPSDLEIIGEPSLSHFIAIAGFVKAESTLLTSTVDVGKIRAVARSHSGPVAEIGVDHHGHFIRDGLKLTAHTVFSLQASNGETGIAQDIDQWRGGAGRIIVDATNFLPSIASPVSDCVTGFAATTFDAASWGGPSGLGFIAITDGKNFRYPLPHIAPIRVPGSYSLPLLIGSAVALSEAVQNSAKQIELRNYCADSLRAIAGLTVMGENQPTSSRHLSAVIDEISAEELLRTLLTREISIDAGSACSPEDLTPSHVIASMGYPTPGHIRMTIHPEHSRDDIDVLVKELRETLAILRG